MIRLGRELWRLQFSEASVSLHQDRTRVVEPVTNLTPTHSILCSTSTCIRRLASLSQLGVATIGEGATYLNALAVEFMCTFVLSMAMLNLFRAQDTVRSDGIGGGIADLAPETSRGEDAEPRASVNPIVVGMLLLVLQVVAAPVSGASLNPAKTLGTAVWAVTTRGGAGSVWIEQWIYWLGPLLGALAAALCSFSAESQRGWHNKPGAGQGGPSAARAFTALRESKFGGGDESADSGHDQEDDGGGIAQTPGGVHHRDMGVLSNGLFGKSRSV